MRPKGDRRVSNGTEPNRRKPKGIEWWTMWVEGDRSGPRESEEDRLRSKRTEGRKMMSKGIESDRRKWIEGKVTEGDRISSEGDRRRSRGTEGGSTEVEGDRRRSKAIDRSRRGSKHVGGDRRRGLKGSEGDRMLSKDVEGDRRESKEVEGDRSRRAPAGSLHTKNDYVVE